jgi:hypothetical protein
MSDNNILINEILAAIEIHIKNNEIDTANQLFILTIKALNISEVKESESISVGKFCASYGYFLCNKGLLKEAIKIFETADVHGYPREDVYEFLVNKYVSPNIQRCQSYYVENIKLFTDYGIIVNALDFNDLPYFIIFPGDFDDAKLFYLLNKKLKVISDSFELAADGELIDNSFSLEFKAGGRIGVAPWDWIVRYPKFLKPSEHFDRTILIVLDFNKSLCALQSVKLKNIQFNGLELYSDVKEVYDHYTQSDFFFPKYAISFSGIDSSEAVKKLIKDVHNFRLVRKNRIGTNILLTIAIPSYNRGARALDNVMHCLRSNHDEEIEIVVSNNGSDIEHNEGYQAIKNIDDSRLRYVESKENQGFIGNLKRLAAEARGQFILYLSDEDKIDFVVLNEILYKLRRGGSSLAVIKYTSSGINGFPRVDKLFKSGPDAFVNNLLSSNYISCAVLKIDLIRDLKIFDYLYSNLENEAVSLYPHMVIEMFLYGHGEVETTSLVLVHEGPAEAAPGDGFLSYATIESRMSQHIGWMKVLDDIALCKDDFKVRRSAHMSLIGKTMYLMVVNLLKFYVPKNEDCRFLFGRACDEIEKMYILIFKNKNKSMYRRTINSDLIKIKAMRDQFLLRLPLLENKSEL